MDDILDLGQQPRCGSCGVVMRTGDGYDECPVCGVREAHSDTEKPPDGAGPTLRGW